MKTIAIYDPALCCSTGVCGTDVDQALVTFSADVDWIKKQGAVIVRYNLSQQPVAFVENEIVKNFLQNSGAEGLPLILVDHAIVMAGRYPTRKEMTRWCELNLTKNDVQENCCDSNKNSCC